jgi:hypothetical protein
MRDLLERNNIRAGGGKDDVRCELDQLSRVSPIETGIVSGPAGINLQIAALGPAEFLQALCERRDARLTFRLIRAEVHQHANAAHSVGLLRPRCERPDNYGTNNSFDETTPSHCRPQGTGPRRL